MATKLRQAEEEQLIKIKGKINEKQWIDKPKNQFLDNKIDSP